MKLISLLLLTFIARGLGQAVQEFAFTQCECRSALLTAGTNGATGFPFTGTSLLGDLFLPSGGVAGTDEELIPPANSFDCGLLGGASGEANNFPDTNGITIDGTGESIDAGTFDTSANFAMLVHVELTNNGKTDVRQIINLGDLQLNLAQDEVRAFSQGAQDNVAETLVTTTVPGGVLVAIGVIDDSGSSDRFIFVCQASVGGNPDPTCDSTVRTFTQGSVDISLMFKRANTVIDASLKAFRVETFGSTSVADNAALTTLLTTSFQNFAITPVVPPVGSTNFQTSEDTQVVVDLSDIFAPSSEPSGPITFAFNDQTELLGTINPGLNANTGQFTYDPVANFSGTRTFTIDYGIGSCLNTGVSIDLNIVADNDDPDVNNTKVLDVFAAARVGFAAELDGIATDVDFFLNNNILPSGTLTVVPVEGVVFSTFNAVDNLCSTVAATSFAIVDSGSSFCVLAPDGLFQGEQEINITVDDGAGGVTEGVITLRGNPPISVDPVNQEQFNNEENNDVTIDISQLVTPEVPEANNFGIRITSLPNAEDGTLRLNGADIVVGDLPIDVSQGDTLVFRPNSGVFNARFISADPLVIRNDGTDGVLIGDCNANERDANNFCEISFDYIGTLGDFTSNDQGTASLKVTAVDDGNPSFALIAGQDQLTAVADEGDNDAFGSFPTFTLSSDNEESVFPIEMEITTSGGANFQFDRTPVGFEINGAQFNGVPRDNCRNFQCTTAFIRTTANQYLSLLGNAVINVDLDADIVNPELILSVIVTENGVEVNRINAEIVYDIEINQIGFFEEPANVGIVAGSGGGLFIVIIGFVLYRVRRAENLKADREIARATLNVQDEMARGVVRKPESEKEKPSSRKKNKGSSSRKKDSSNKKQPKNEDIVEDIGQGWEKHYDAKSKAYFYYNPATDTTQWDFPEDLNTGRKKRLQTQDLNL